MQARVHSVLVLGLLSCMTRVAGGAGCLALRPTSTEAEWSYDGAPVSHFDTPQGHFRVWYATEGRHAPLAVTPNAAPEAATLAGGAAEVALSRYQQLGFRTPLADDENADCSDNGGGARLDLYLFDFAAADGTIVVSSCQPTAPELCSGFMLVENDFAGSAYASAGDGFRTVVPHELFHLVQRAYSSNAEAWWNEGTAQWAAKQVFPELQDLEAFLPAFFARTDRPLDFPPIGAAAAFSYGAAIWPVFLGERFGLTTPREAFQELSQGASSALSATQTSLASLGSDLPSAFAEFARWNLATAERSDPDGYARAALYPEVPLDTMPATLPSRVEGKLAGLSARYFATAGGDFRQLALVANQERVQAWFVPLEDGAAALARAKELPTSTDAAGVVVITGNRTDHRDVAYEVAATIVENEGDGGASGGAGAALMPPADAPLDEGQAMATPADGGASSAPGEALEAGAPDHDEPADAPSRPAMTPGSRTPAQHASGGCFCTTRATSSDTAPSVLAMGLGAAVWWAQRRGRLPGINWRKT